jgi:hypothetical protein
MELKIVGSLFVRNVLCINYFGHKLFSALAIIYTARAGVKCFVSKLHVIFITVAQAILIGGNM